MNARDVGQVIEIEKVSFPTPWSEGMFRKELCSPISWTFVAILSVNGTEKIAGYINFWMFAGEIHLNNIAVIPGMKRKGVASGLLTKMFKIGREKGALEATLEVRKSNTAARSLYVKFGFVVRGLRPLYYTDTGEDAIIMWADVPFNDAEE